MFPTLITHLVAGGLADIAEDLMDTIVTNGEEAVVSTLKEVTGLDFDLNKVPSKAQVEALVNSSSLIKSALDSSIKLTSLEVDIEDVKDARRQAQDMRKSNSIFTRHFLEIFSLTIFIGSLVFFYKFLDSYSDNPMAATIIQFLFNGDMLILGYWYGSSKGSKDKTELLGKDL